MTQSNSSFPEWAPSLLVDWIKHNQDQLDNENTALKKRLDIARALCSNPDMESAWSIMTGHSREPAFEIAVLYAVHRAYVHSQRNFTNPKSGVNRQAGFAKHLQTLVIAIEDIEKKESTVGKQRLREVFQSVSIQKIAGVSCPINILREVNHAIKRAKEINFDGKLIEKLCDTPDMLRDPNSKFINSMMEHVNWVTLPTGHRIIRTQVEPPADYVLFSDLLSFAASRAEASAHAPILVTQPKSKKVHNEFS